MAPLAPGKKHTATLGVGDSKRQMLICFLICPPIGPFCFPVLVLLCKLHVYFSGVREGSCSLPSPYIPFFWPEGPKTSVC